MPHATATLVIKPITDHGTRNSAPGLGSVHIRLPSALDEPTRDALRQEAFEQPGQR